jgi:hypothetical protein
MLNEVCVNLCPRIANVDRKNLPLLPFTAWFRFFMAQFLRTLTAPGDRAGTASYPSSPVDRGWLTRRYSPAAVSDLLAVPGR